MDGAKPHARRYRPLAHCEAFLGCDIFFMSKHVPVALDPVVPIPNRFAALITTLLVTNLSRLDMSALNNKTLMCTVTKSMRSKVGL